MQCSPSSKTKVNYRKIKYIFVFISFFIFYNLQAQEPSNEILEAETTSSSEEIRAGEIDETSVDKTIAEAASEGGSAGKSNENKADTPEVVEKPVTETNPDFDVFQPSEDISEDLAVPFPVDI